MTSKLKKFIGGNGGKDIDDKSTKKQIFRRCEDLIIKEPFAITISNYAIDTKFASVPLVDQNNFDTGYPYYNMEVNIPSTFQELSNDRAILHGWTHESSEMYKGKGGQNVANCIMSIAMKKVYPVKTWLRPKLDEILTLGDALYAQVKATKSTIKSLSAADFDDTKIIIEGKKYYIDVDLLTIVGTLSSQLPSVLNIKQALEEFFLINIDGIIECSSMAIAAWTQDDYFYMFDPRQCDAEGIRIIEEKDKRRKSKKKDSSDLKKKILGKSCVIRFSSVDALVAQFLKNVDPAKKNDRFIIRHLTIMNDTPGTRPWCEFQPGESGRTWVLLGNLSNESDEFDDASRGIQGIAMPVVALINATEIKPNEWSKETVDEVVRQGDVYFNWCIPPEQEDEIELSLRNLKKNLYIKNRRVKINIQESSVVGDIKATSDVQLPNLSKGIIHFFDTHQFGIVEVKDLSIAIWKFEKEQKVKNKNAKENIKETSYYYYDPNPRGEIGQCDPEDDEEIAACVIRALDPVELARRIEMNINPTATGTDEYFIHSLKVESISDPMTAEEIEIDKRTPVKPDLNAYIEMGDDGAYLNGTFDQSNAIQFKPRTRNKQQAANALVTLAMRQIYNPHLWYREVIDDILKLGDKITQENMINIPDEQEVQGDTTVIEPLRDYLLPNEIDETFDIGVNRVTVLIDEAIGMRPVGNLSDALTEFFTDNLMGILRQERAILPIWKEGNIYFTMDPCARNRDESKKLDDSTATVFWFTSLSSLAANIQQSLINPNGNITIEAVELQNEYETRLAENERPKKTTSADHLWHNFPKKIDGVWELTGDVAINDERFPLENRGKQTAALAVMAIIFSKVYEPRQWTKEILDEVVITGDKLHDKSIARLGDNISPRVNQILAEFFLSNRRLNITVKDCVQTGEIKISPTSSSKIQDLKSGIENFFQNNISGVITLTNNLNIAIWKSKDHYYCLIPDVKLSDDQATEIKPRLSRYSTAEHVVNDLNDLANAGNDFEIHSVDVLDWNKSPPWKFDPSPAIRPSNLPPLNAFKQLQGSSRAILRGGIHQGSDIFLETMRNHQTAANCAVALGMSVIKNPVTWTKNTLDDILVIGCTVHCESLKLHPKKMKLKPTDVIRIFRIGVNVLTADIDETTMTGQVAIPPPEPEVKGKKKTKVKKSPRVKGKKKKQLREPPPPPPSPILLEEGLKKFFENNHAGILVAGRFMIAIWKDQGIYFMFDPHARSDQGSVAEDGVACTMWFACIEPFYELIFNNIDQLDKFGRYDICRTIIRTTIIEPLPRPVEFQPFFDCTVPPIPISWEKKTLTLSVETLSEYYPVDDELSVLLGTIHMRDRIFDVTARGFQSTAIAAVAIAVGVLHVPSTWTGKIIDSILKYGDVLYRDSVKMSRSGPRTLSPSELLTEFIVGDFKATVHIHRHTTAGILLVPDLAQALTLFFQNNCAGILHTPNLAVAVMQHYGKFYLLDPSECDKFGNVSYDGAASIAKCENIMKLASLFVNNCNYKVPCVYTINNIYDTNHF
ncbi:hypothetical protein PV325_006941 [Microctonus aethiopoides]|nr:hypothetical protein PV325_006941 [Microctonus aethiopoides]